MGHRIAFLRIDSNQTQSVFGKKYDVNRLEVIRWENGVHIPRMNVLKQMAKDYNTTVEWILYGEGEKDGRSPMDKT
ncbi:helix-turn-helix transcriptional regulator [Staphylococcus saprophyticus]|uniref:helix-turn-helix transcriptional regulator n=1 Tax=Staphylococcus saprophyticus TaxID=29385 RepID=UPI0016425EE3|nr:helix-turn-helix transcriptional regulator [Staphylococcus saprophyticus]